MVLWANDVDHASCMSCAARFTFARRRHHCRRCGGVFCSRCCRKTVSPAAAAGTSEHDAVAGSSGGQGRGFFATLLGTGKPKAARTCTTCRSWLFRLSDEQLMFIQVFLDPEDQDALMRVCRRLQRLVLIAFDRLEAIAQRFAYNEATDVLSRTPRATVLRCHDRLTTNLRVLKIIHKDALYTRRDWQDLQFSIDTLGALNHPSLIPIIAVYQTRYSVILVLEHLGDHWVRLDRFAKEKEVPEGVAGKIVMNLIRALDFLHREANIVHRCLAPEHILVDSLSHAVKITGLQFAKNCAVRGPPGMSYGNLAGIMSQPLASRTFPSNVSFGAAGTGGGGEATTRLFQNRADPPPKPPPIIIPGGRDDKLDRRSMVFTKAAADRMDSMKADTIATLSHRSFTAPDPSITDSFLRGSVRIASSPKGKPRYAAPEVAELYAAGNHHPIGFSVASRVLTVKDLQKWDMYSLGCIMYFLLSGQHLWRSDRWEVLALVMYQRGAVDFAKDKHLRRISHEAANFMHSLLRVSVLNRVTAVEALRDPWFTTRDVLQQLRTDSEALSPPPAPRRRGGGREHRKQRTSPLPAEDEEESAQATIKALTPPPPPEPAAAPFEPLAADTEPLVAHAAAAAEESSSLPVQ